MEKNYSNIDNNSHRHNQHRHQKNRVNQSIVLEELLDTRSAVSLVNNTALQVSGGLLLHYMHNFLQKYLQTVIIQN